LLILLLPRAVSTNETGLLGLEMARASPQLIFMTLGDQGPEMPVLPLARNPAADPPRRQTRAKTAAKGDAA